LTTRERRHQEKLDAAASLLKSTTKEYDEILVILLAIIFGEKGVIHLNTPYYYPFFTISNTTVIHLNIPTTHVILNIIP